jgi:hypothetical protein
MDLSLSLATKGIEGGQAPIAQGMLPAPGEQAQVQAPVSTPVYSAVGGGGDFWYREITKPKKAAKHSEKFLNAIEIALGNRSSVEPTGAIEFRKIDPEVRQFFVNPNYLQIATPLVSYLGTKLGSGIFTGKEILAGTTIFGLLWFLTRDKPKYRWGTRVGSGIALAEILIRKMVAWHLSGNLARPRLHKET